MRFASVLLLLISAFLLHGASLPADLYKYVGPDGKVVYSDRPPPDGRPTATLNVRASAKPIPAPFASTLGKTAGARTPAPAPAPSSVTLFTTAWCRYCRQAKAYLDGKGIGYHEYDIETPAGSAAYTQAGGTSGVPLLVAGKQRVQGFSAQAYDRLFAAPR